MKMLKYKDNEIRTFEINNDIYWCASDVGKVLGFSDIQRQIKKLDTKGGTTIPTLTNGGMQSLLYINEPSLYELVFKSRLKEAKAFRDWVFFEVLPKIRKTGEYSVAREISNESKKNRNNLTSSWKQCGIEKPYEYIQLTLQEYKSLGFDKNKRKKDFKRSEILALNALEAMESYKLFNTDVNGYLECKKSLIDTANNVSKLIEIKKSTKEI